MKQRFLVFLSAYGQDIKYARMVLDTLCSAHFDGRGYFNNGEKRAADFIKSEYVKSGLQPINNAYFQYFNLPTNSIKGAISFKVNKTELQGGKDYLISPTSTDYFGEKAVFTVDKSALIDLEVFKKVIPLLLDKFVLVDKTLIANESREIKNQVAEIIQFLKYQSDFNIEGVVEVVGEKLIYTAAQNRAVRPHVIVLKDKLPRCLKRITLKVESEFNSNHQSQNVIGFIEGEIKDEFIYVVGHYDHLGRMGEEVFFPGANDNASGIAMLLNLVKYFATEKKPKYSMVFISFGAEEIGLVGSKYYTENPLLPLDKIKFLINLDILGTGDDGIKVVNGKKHQKEFDDLVKINEDNGLLKQVKIRGEACNSDHCFFTEKGVPSFFIYTLGGIAHYHNIYDASATLPLTKFEDLFLLLKEFVIGFK